MIKKLLKFKTLLAIAILLTGIIGAWAIGQNNALKNQPLLKATTVADKATNLKFDFSKILNGSSTQNGIAQRSSKNLTQNLANLYTREILNRNLNGPTSDANGAQQLTVPSQDIFTNILQENLNQDLAFNQFTAKDIKISADNSVDKQLKYMRTFSQITAKNFNSSNPNIFAALDKLLNNDDSTLLQKQIDALTNQINDVLALAVPSLWKEFDLQALNLWQKNIAIYQSFSGLNDDPLKTYVALNQFSDIFSEFQSLNNVLLDRYQELTVKK